jgi:hypothetical protein
MFMALIGGEFLHAPIHENKVISIDEIVLNHKVNDLVSIGQASAAAAPAGINKDRLAFGDIKSRERIILDHHILDQVIILPNPSKNIYPFPLVIQDLIVMNPDLRNPSSCPIGCGVLASTGNQRHCGSICMADVANNFQIFNRVPGRTAGRDGQRRQNFIVGRVENSKMFCIA